MVKKVLVIGGSDPLAGGGIQTDVKTLENHQLFALTALTCVVTVQQNDFTVHSLGADLLAQQLASLSPGSLAGIKLGLIHDPQMIPVIKDFLMANQELPLVLDPVSAFKETEKTYSSQYLELLAQELFPLAAVITPNLAEACQLTGTTIASVAEMSEAAKRLTVLGAKNVVIKGGARLAGQQAVDLFFDGSEAVLLTKPKTAAKTVNGAGCAFATAAAANLVRGSSLLEAFKKSKDYVYQALQGGVMVDQENGSVWHGGQLADPLQAAAFME